MTKLLIVLTALLSLTSSTFALSISEDLDFHGGIVKNRKTRQTLTVKCSGPDCLTFNFYIITQDQDSTGVEKVNSHPLTRAELDSIEQRLLALKTNDASILPKVMVDENRITTGWFFNITASLWSETRTNPGDKKIIAAVVLLTPLTVASDLAGTVLIDTGAIVSWPARELVSKLSNPQASGQALAILSDPNGKTKTISNRNFNRLVNVLKAF